MIVKMIPKGLFIVYAHGSYRNLMLISNGNSCMNVSTETPSMSNSRHFSASISFFIFFFLIA